MKKSATLAASLLLSFHALPAQQKAAPPAATAKPAASPAATASPAPSAAAAQPDNSSPRAIADSLSEAEVQEALGILKSSYLNPAAVSDPEASRAALQGFMERLAPGATILPAGEPANQPGPLLRSTMLANRTGYLRLGSLTQDNLAQLDAALKGFIEAKVESVILDLRVTVQSSNFELAAEVTKRFCAKGQELFSIKKGGSAQERIFTSNQDPKFQGVLIVLIDNESAGAAEVIAAVLRDDAKAMLIGENTTGQAVEFADVPLKSGKILHVAVAEAVLPGSAQIYPKGVKPDLVVPMDDDAKHDIMRLSLDKGVTAFVVESERPRMNEAALVAGINPELDALQAAQGNHNDKGKSLLRDVQLQRAIDLITTIGIYQSKGREGQK